MSDDEGGLFCIAIDSDEETKAKPRDQQTEEEFQQLRRTYRVKEQNGEATKPVLQEVLHAVEELYFLRRFDEAAAFARRVLDGSEAALDRDTREMLGRYEEKCRGRMGN
ncbi:hypothetical protein CkaCkLH20_00236 [Colletotrichum karsti]|uniref:Uncharacterized protein n=1 Tax=Colletotrichum karsti TaxID=1095194 RepID=A0A9P6IG69_9PEZI|nr:uncharacterized protein CkaCkLH20_00236 [Colletotrichum karsti]KAF9882200.1 hypothetical protein CkaCkLH20_00236 [Colletotrichum karsti]